MSYKKSVIVVQKNSKIWEKQLITFQNSLSMSRMIPNIETQLYELNKMPSQKIIIGRFNALAKSVKSKNKRYVTISGELHTLWEKMSIPKLTKRSVKRKVENLIQLYHKYSRKEKSGVNFEDIFNITNEVTDFKSEDLDFQSKEIDLESLSSYTFEDNISSSESDNYKPPARLTRNPQSTVPAVELVNKVHISTRKAAKICEELAQSGIKISTPSQPAIYKAVMKSAEQKEELLKKQLKEENWCLHFDGKKINGKEVQVILLKNESKEIYLGVLVLDDGKANSISHAIKDILSKFELYECIKMIICDTTAVNTGNKNGVVIQLQNYFKSIKLNTPQYVGCQHHILDLILRHVMDELLGGKTSSPEICYNFIPELINNYNELKISYTQNKEKIDTKNIKWRDDMQYLFELGNAFRYFQKNQKFPFIKFKTIPPISNARWNSRAILALLAFILIPKYRSELYPICDFICGQWYDIWFSDHQFNEDNFQLLKLSLARFENAKKCFLKHWVQDDSFIKNQQRSNICAERAIKIVQDIYPFCKSTRTLNLKFLSYNSN